MTIHIYLCSVLLLLFFSCGQNKKEANSYNRGNMILQYDDAYSNIAEALASRYEIAYPETKINLSSSKEYKALENLLNKKVNAIIMSRDLTAEEKKYWDINIRLPWNPSYFAADAVCFITNFNSTRNSISLFEIKEMLKSQDKKIIFEEKNASNFNSIINIIKLDSLKKNFYRVKSKKHFVNYIANNTDYIGIVECNILNNIYKKNQNLKINTKILPINMDNDLVYPNKQNLKSQKYPFINLLYFITNEPKFGLANGFIRYSTNIGQKIVNKEGLQPFFLFPRTIKINVKN